MAVDRLGPHLRGPAAEAAIGGAAINRSFGRRILFAEERRPYAGGVFYCKDAFEGLETMDTLIDPEKRPALLAKTVEESEMELGRKSVKTFERSNV